VLFLFLFKESCMVPVIVVGLLLLVTAARRGEEVAAPVAEVKPPVKEKAVKIPVPPRALRPVAAALKPTEARKPPIDVHEYQRRFTPPPPLFKVELTGYDVPPQPTPY
jgi:hypothetical protein